MKYFIIASLATISFVFTACADHPSTTSTTTEESSVVHQPTESTTTQTTIQKN